MTAIRQLDFKFRAQVFFLYFHTSNSHLLIILTSLESSGLENMASVHLCKIKGRSGEANRFQGSDSRDPTGVTTR